MSLRRTMLSLLALCVVVGLLPASGATAAVNKPPKIKKAVMKDKDGDGLADKVVLTYNERIKHKVDKRRFPFKVAGYRIKKINAARGSRRLVILLRESADAPLRPASISYKRTRKQPVKDMKNKQARKQFLTKNIIGLTVSAVTHVLTVEKDGNGTGTVTSSPAGINCGATCQASFNDGASVTLTATPDAEASPEVAWTGCTTNPTPTTCSVSMTAAKTVGVTFSAAGSKTLSVSKQGDGAVTSSSTPDQETQIDCSSTCASTTASFPENSLVTLTAVPAQEGMLVTWGGDCSGTGTTCDLLMDAAKTVTVKFELPVLTVALAGTGTGTVTSSPVGITCGSVCSAEFAKDQDVTLTAAPASGSEFGGWSGDATCGTNTSCVVKMTESKNVTATFNLEGTGPTTYSLTITKKGDGSGTVTCATDGVTFTACRSSYEEGTTLTLSANPDLLTGSVFAGWGGDCAHAGTLLLCTLNMSQGRVVEATFDDPLV